MKNKSVLTFVLIASLLLSACTTQPLKAPCNSHASLCGAKNKINQW